jgi:hypothetical protein
MILTIGVLTILSYVTVFQRVYYVWNELDR